MRKSNHLSIKLLANIALRPRYEEISVSISQEGCQNSPRHTMENCQMIDYRIVCRSQSRSLFFAILSSILCGVLPILAVRSLCVCDGLSDDLLVYCQRCSGNLLQKKQRRSKEEKGKGCRDHSCRNAAQMSFYFIVFSCPVDKHNNRNRNPSMSFSLTPRGCLIFIGIFALFAFNSRRLAIFTSP